MVTKQDTVFISRNSSVRICYVKCGMKRSEEPKSLQVLYTASLDRLNFVVKYDFN